ncbi:MAG: O-methyltransferase [Cyanobacteria bacterium SIG30]|nr:O-methyltransferase [Cyanobacteria bacterium SIG30]
MPNFDKKTEEILIALEKTQEEFWNVDRATANYLNLMVKALNVQNALEIGTSNGYSAIWIAKGLKETNGKLTTIEFWDKRLDLAKENFKECGVDDIITTKLGSASDVLLDLQNEIYDFVFIDANKLEYLNYFKRIDPILKKGGVILSDNIISHAKKVQPFLDEILSRKDYQSELLNFQDGLLISRKNL